MAKVLVVDDDEAAGASLRQVLISRNHRVTVCFSGTAALRLASKTKYDLLVCDLFMPEKDGIEVMLAFQKMHPTTPMIAISGGAFNRRADLLPVAAQLGAKCTFQKPFSANELLEAVSALSPPEHDGP